MTNYKRKGKRHYEPKQLIAELNHIAREKRMATRTPDTAAGIICGYGLYKSENIRQSQLAKVVKRLTEYQEMYRNGEIDNATMSKRIMDKADFSIEYEDYTLDDITKRKGSFDYWLDSIQIGAQNTINQYATAYMLMFYNSLIDELGFGKTRLNRVNQCILYHLEEYQYHREKITDWINELYENLGVLYEMPIDPLTQTSGSCLTGQE